MDKEKILGFLNDGLTAEEVPVLSNIAGLEELISHSAFDAETKMQLIDSLKTLQKDTVWHSKSFSEMLNIVLKSDKNEY